MNVLIIGGGGFLGWHTVRELLRCGHRASILTRSPVPAVAAPPAGAPVHVADVNAVAEDALLRLLADHEAVVFAAGADDRTTPKAPASDYFHYANVTTCVRAFSLARRAGVRRGVIAGSYFPHFCRVWPELELGRWHPYIRSRLEQADASLAAVMGDLELMILELPWIMGGMPGRRPLWSPLVCIVRSPLLPLVAPPGGTNMIAVKHVAEAIVNALERGEGGQRYTVGEENRPYAWLMEQFARLVGRPRKARIIPRPLVGAGLRLIGTALSLQGREPGVDTARATKLLTAKLYFDPEPARRALGFGRGGLADALRETVEACGRKWNDPALFPLG